MSKSELTKEREARQRTEKLKQLAPAVIFIKRLTATLFGLAILGLGIVALTSNIDQPRTVKVIAYLVSGTCAVVDGVYLLYVALMKVGR